MCHVFMRHFATLFFAMLFVVLAAALSAAAQDTDSDGILDVEDNCLSTANPSQYDADIDGYGNACDADVNNDGVVGGPDLGPFNAAFGSQRGDENFDPRVDVNGDGVIGGPDMALINLQFGNPPGPSGVACAGTVGCASCPYSSITDTDSDGVVDTFDNCVEVTNAAQTDPGGDGYGLLCDGDLNDDGLNQTGLDWPLFVFGSTAGDPGYLEDADYSSSTQGLGFPDGVIGGPDLGVFSSFPLGSPVGPSGLVCPAFEALPSPSDARIQVVEDLTFFGSLLQPAPDPNDGLTFAVVDRPDYGTLVVIDERTGAFRYDATGSSGRDSFTWLIGTGFSSTEEATVDLEIWDPAGDEFVADGLSNDVLIVYNVNSPNDDAEAIAQHYQTQRFVPAANMCPVEMPPGLYATKDQFMALREQVVDCICNVSGAIPGCGLATLDALRAQAPVSHLALIRGLPARLYGTGTSGDFEEPVLDLYLAHLVYHEEGEIFGADDGEVPKPLFKQRCPTPDCPHPADLDPAHDGVVAFGRVEALNRDRTIALIDRTLGSEDRGFRGNITTGTLDQFDEHRRRTAGHASICTDYLTVGSGLTWPYEDCRAGTTQTDGPPVNLAPGNATSVIPEPRNIAFHVSNGVSTQQGFEGFPTMVKWQHTDCDSLSLAPVCADATCEALSTDYFQQLDTRCVGAASDVGFLGTQLRSFPVRGYGFMPWGWRNGNVGANENTLPTLEFSGGADADGRYIHYGLHSLAEPDASSCDGSPCPERIFLVLEAIMTDPPVVEDGRSLTFRLQKRHPTNAAGAALRVRLLIDQSPVATQTLSLEADTPTWTSAPELALDLPDNGGAAIEDLRIRLEITRPMVPVHEFLDLDAIELVDTSVAPEVELLPAEKGHFSRVYQNSTQAGDWATNAIDRLGGIGWWGSSSHFPGVEYAIAGTKHIRAFFSGRTIGEAIASKLSAPSILVYLDPLYRASAAALFIPGRPEIHGMSPNPSVADILATSGPTVGAGEQGIFSRIWVDAMHGMASLATVNWEISACRGFDVNACDSGAGWVTGPLQTGNKKGLAYDWTPLIDTATDGPVTLRLRVWNVGEEEHALYDFAFFDWQVNTLP